MFGLKRKQCICGSKAFLGRRCALCNEPLPEAPEPSGPAEAILRRFYRSWILHLVPIWLIYGATILISESIWVPSPRGHTPAGFYALLLVFLSLGYLGAPLAAYFRGRGMRLPSQSEQRVAVVLVRIAAMVGMFALMVSMVTGSYPNLR